MEPLAALQRLLRQGVRDPRPYDELLALLPQRSLLSLYEDELFAKYPLLAAARRCFAKAALRALEGQEEVDDEVYERCASEVLRSSSDGHGHKIFEIGQGHQGGHQGVPGPVGLVVLRVAEQLGGGFETGGRLWAGGCMLLGLALANALDTLLIGHVLELGAGTGLLGLSLALRGHRVTLSDNQPQAAKSTHAY